MGGQGTIGEGASWANTLPKPPTNDDTWIVMRDIGVPSGGNNEESVTATMTGMIAGKLYKLELHAMTALSNEDGGTGNSDFYAGSLNTVFNYQVGSNPQQNVTLTTNTIHRDESRRAALPLRPSRKSRC